MRKEMPVAAILCGGNGQSGNSSPADFHATGAARQGGFLFPRSRRATLVLDHHQLRRQIRGAGWVEEGRLLV